MYEYNNEFDWVNAHLTTDEYVLWRGKPVPGHVFSRQDIVMIPFSLFWCGFAIFWETMVLSSGAPFFFCIWGIPFILAGLYLVVGRFFHRQSIRKNTYYVVTNRRILCLKKNSVETLDYQNIPEFYTTLNKDGSGTIFFGPRYYGTRGHQGRTIPFSMENIPEMNTVLRMISEQKRI